MQQKNLRFYYPDNFSAHLISDPQTPFPSIYFNGIVMETAHYTTMGILDFDSMDKHNFEQILKPAIKLVSSQN